MNLVSVLEDLPSTAAPPLTAPGEHSQLSSASLKWLNAAVEEFRDRLTNVKQTSQSRRLVRVAEETLDKMAKNLSGQLSSLNASQEVLEERPEAETSLIHTRGRLLQKQVQLFYQKVFEHVREFWEQQADQHEKEQSRKESFDRTTVLTGSEQAPLALPATAEKDGQVHEGSDLSISEQQSFTQGLAAKLSAGLSDQADKPLLQKISSLASELFSMSGIPDQERLSSKDLAQLELAAGLLGKVSAILSFVIRQQCCYLASLCKFSYITQRVFLYLIFQGFCGKDDKEEDTEQQREDDDRYLDGDGCGMGDG